jgi:hypothetical protein
MATLPAERTEVPESSTYSTDAPAVYELGEGSAPDPTEDSDPLTHHKPIKRPPEPDRVQPEPEPKRRGER